jgi:hypothetical protein
MTLGSSRRAPPRPGSAGSNTLPTPPSALRSPSWPASPAPAGRSRSASRPRRTSAAWTSTRSAAIPAGIGTSPWPCSPTPSSPHSPPRPAAVKGPQKRISPRPTHRGRDPAPAGRPPAAPPASPGQTPTCLELVALAQTPPSHSSLLPLPKKNQLRTRGSTGVLTAALQS